MENKNSEYMEYVDTWLLVEVEETKLRIQKNNNAQDDSPAAAIVGGTAKRPRSPRTPPPTPIGGCCTAAAGIAAGTGSSSGTTAGVPPDGGGRDCCGTRWSPFQPPGWGSGTAILELYRTRAACAPHAAEAGSKAPEGEEGGRTTRVGDPPATPRGRFPVRTPGSDIWGDRRTDQAKQRHHARTSSSGWCSGCCIC